MLPAPHTNVSAAERILQMWMRALLTLENEPQNPPDARARIAQATANDIQSGRVRA